MEFQLLPLIATKQPCLHPQLSVPRFWMGLFAMMATTRQTTMSAMELHALEKWRWCLS
jgi:hypothetical protein